MENLLSKGECIEIIKNSTKTEDFVVQDYKIVPVEGYPGYLGDYFRLEIIFKNVSQPENQIKTNELKFQGQNETKSEIFFVKTLPINNMEKRELMIQYGIFEKEVLIYQHLVPELLKYSGQYPINNIYQKHL